MTFFWLYRLELKFEGAFFTIKAKVLSHIDIKYIVVLLIEVFPVEDPPVNLYSSYARVLNLESFRDRLGVSNYRGHWERWRVTFIAKSDLVRWDYYGASRNGYANWELYWG